VVKTQDIAGILDGLSRLPVLAIDTETTGLGWNDRAFSIQIAGEGCAYYFDARIVGWSGLDTVKRFLNEYQGTLVFKNAKFDLHKANLDPRATVADIEVLERLINNTYMSYRLADQAKRYGLEKHDTVSEYVKKHGLKNWMDVPIEIMAPYATNDAEITYKIYQLLIQQLDPRSMPVWENECALTKVCARIEARGIRIDNDTTHKALAYERSVVNDLHKEFKNITGREFNNSKSLLVEVFLAGGDTLPFTDKGNYKLDDDTLSGLSSPAAKVVQEIRHYEKRISTYYGNFISLQDEKGFIHADIRQAGTATGRISYRDPNFQNVPKEDEESDKGKPFVVRQCLIPREGHSFISLDYSQQEYRLMLAYANERRLIEQVMAGVDLHKATGDMVGIDRKPAKTLNFAVIYGAGRQEIARLLNTDIGSASRLKDKYFMRLPKVEQFIDHVISTARDRGYIYNWLGRKLTCPGRDYAYKMPNWLIQGGGADICKRAMVELAHYPIALQVHDQLVLEVPHKDVRSVARDAQKKMIEVFPEKNGMKMAVDVRVSAKSFAERDMEDLCLEEK
jgi:DNA polymerase-1